MIEAIQQHYMKNLTLEEVEQVMLTYRLETLPSMTFEQLLDELQWFSKGVDVEGKAEIVAIIRNELYKRNYS